MDRLIPFLKKRALLLAIFAGALLFWVFLCKVNYDSYWDGTIFKVQTVDFNMLHHTLPVTLSELVVAGRDDLIQSVLDSTYGIFGLVITDPAGRSVLYRTGKVYHQGSWQKVISPEYLSRSPEPYDLLTDPPPLEPVFEHSSPRAALATQVGRLPASRVLGRVYYVRQPPPPFASDISHFLTTNWVELSGSKRGYLLQTLVTVGFTLALIFLVLLRQRTAAIAAQEKEYLGKELEIRQKALDHLTAELVTQNSRKKWLEQEAEQTYKRALLLKEALERLKVALSVPETSVQCDWQVKIRPPGNPPSIVLSELESLIPVLTSDAQQLRSQADQMQGYCRQLENSQEEMKRVVEQVVERVSSYPRPGNLLHFRSKG